MLQTLQVLLLQLPVGHKISLLVQHAFYSAMVCSIHAHK